ncbi:hypothetical protein Tco_0459323 [Tanacetum coccineum]
MAAEIPQTLEYWGGQLNVAPLLEVENFINWKKRDSELAILFGKLKYEENLIDSIYDTEKKKSLTIATPLSTTFISTSIFHDFHNSPDDEEDTRNNQEYKNDMEMEFHERALSTKSKRFFKNGASTTKSSQVRNQGLVAEAYEWNEEEVSSDDNEMVNLIALADDESGVVGKESARNAKDSNVSKLNVERPWLSKAKGFNLANHDTGRILLSQSHVNVTDSSVTVNVTDYDSAEKSTSVCSTLLPLLEKLPGAELQTELQPGPKIIKSILKACSSRKAKTSKDVVINETINSSAPTKGTKNVLASKRNSASSGKLKKVKTKADIPIVTSGRPSGTWTLDDQGIWLVSKAIYTNM